MPFRQDFSERESEALLIFARFHTATVWNASGRRP